MANQFRKFLKKAGRAATKVVKYAAPVAGVAFGGVLGGLAGTAAGTLAGQARAKNKKKAFFRSLAYGGGVTAAGVGLAAISGNSLTASGIQSVKSLFGGGAVAAPDVAKGAGVPQEGSYGLENAFVQNAGGGAPSKGDTALSAALTAGLNAFSGGRGGSPAMGDAGVNMGGMSDSGITATGRGMFGGLTGTGTDLSGGGDASLAGAATGGPPAGLIIAGGALLLLFLIRRKR